MTPSQLVVGSVYFMPVYEDVAMTRLIVMSFTYLGQFEHESEGGSEQGFHFDFMPPHRYDEGPEVSNLHFYSESDLSNFVDVGGLFREIELLRSRLGE